MKEIEIGVTVRFRRGSRLPKEWQMPSDARGMVMSNYPSPRQPTHFLLDVDFGPDVLIRRPGIGLRLSIWPFQMSRFATFITSGAGKIAIS